MKLNALAIKSCLVLAPHTDDGELGAGGLISSLVSAGTKVHYAAFSTANESVPAGFPPDVLEHEVAAATKLLGISSENLNIYNFPVRKFPAFRQEILETLVELRKSVKPELVLTTCSFDVHQDHQVLHNEAKRAFKTTTILGYELLWNEVGESNFGVFFEMSEELLNSKLNCLEAYESQRGRLYFDRDTLSSLAKVRGLQVGLKYAEAYEAIRLVMT